MVYGDRDTNVTRARSPRRAHRRGRGLLITLGVIAALVLVVRLIADPVAAHFTKKSFEKLKGYKGTFDGVHVTFLPPGYEVRKLKIIETGSGGTWKEPLFYADRTHTTVLWRKLLDGDLVARQRLENPKIVIARQQEKKTKKELPELSQQLANAAPVKVDRLEILDGEVLFAQSPAKGAPQLWIHDLELAAENITTRQAMADGRPLTVTARAIVQKSGKFVAFLTADPWSKGLNFAGRVELRNLALTDMHAFLAENQDIQATKGTLSAFADFTVKGDRLTGGVKPVLSNVELRPAKKGLFTKLKAWFADETFEILSDDVPGRNAVATTIPLRGTITSPDAQILPTVLGVLRNAFVMSLEGGFANVPPETAEKKEGFFEQVKETFKRGEGPPDAQPDTKKKDGDGPAGRTAQGRRGEKR